MRDLPKVVENLTKASTLLTRPSDKAAVERDLGLAYYQMRKFPEAEKAYLASLQAGGDNPITMNNLAFMYINDMDQPDRAVPIAAKAAQKAPNNGDVLDTYGWALAKTGAYAEAEKQLTRAVQLSAAPSSAAVARYHLGWVCEQTKRPEDAARHYRQVRENLTDPNDPLQKAVTEALQRVEQKPSNAP